MSNTINNETQALQLLEQVRNQIESNFYQMRDELLTSDQLFTMRIELQDACDALMLATRHIERVAQARETEDFTA